MLGVGQGLAYRTVSISFWVLWLPLTSPGPDSIVLFPYKINQKIRE